MKLSSNIRRWSLVVWMLPCLAQAQPKVEPKEPPPSTVSIQPLGQINPTKYISMADYLARYSGVDPQTDLDIRNSIKAGGAGQVAIPVDPTERPPGPLMVYVDSKKRKTLEFSLSLGGVSQRFPVPRGQNLDIYLAANGASSAKLMEGKKRKIHSIPIPEACEEMLLFFVKPPTLSWKDYRVIPVDYSRKSIPARSVLILNFSQKALLVQSEDSSSANQEGQPRQLLEPGARLLFKIPEELSTIRIMYSDPANPDKILCAVNCDAVPNKRMLAFSYDLGVPENGVEVATKSLQTPVEPLQVETLAGVREIPEGQPDVPE